MMKTIKITRSTVCAGKDLIAGKTYELEDKNANLLVSLGKAVVVDSEKDLPIKEDTTVPIEQMKKAELLAYADGIGVEVDESMTKAQIIEAINEADNEDGEE